MEVQGGRDLACARVSLFCMGRLPSRSALSCRLLQLNSSRRCHAAKKGGGREGAPALGSASWACWACWAKQGCRQLPPQFYLDKLEYK